MATTAPDVFDVPLPTISYHGALHPEDAHSAIRRARQQSPIALGPYGLELLSYDLVRTALRDRRFAMPLGNGLAASGITSGPVWDRLSASLVGLDGPRHLRLRRLVARAFTPRSAERMRAACAATITTLVDRCRSIGRCDVVADIAQPYPIPVLCSLLGVPRADWPLFSPCIKGISHAFTARVADKVPLIVAAWTELDSYLDELIADKRRRLSDDLISDLIRAEDEGDRLTHAELLNLVAVLLIAGTDTTRNQLAAAVQVLCAHTDQWAMVRDDPRLAANAVGEVMRHTPVSISVIRTVTEDVELGGVVIPSGTFVVVNTAAANRDPAVYDAPDRFDIGRRGAPMMLTFGGGAHNCLGAHLARVQLEEALLVITRRLPNLKMTGPAPWRPIVGISGPRALSVEFD